MNGIIYVVGGMTGHTAFGMVEAYDPAVNTWTKKADMPTARGFLGTSAVNGKIYAIGGSTRSVSSTVSTVEEYTPPSVTSVEDPFDEQNNPTVFVLYQNYPNPFNPETRLRYQLTQPNRVLLQVFNLLGQEVRTLVDENKPAGFYEETWDGKDNHGLRVASGVYLYKLESGDSNLTKKMLLLQ